MYLSTYLSLSLSLSLSADPRHRKSSLDPRGRSHDVARYSGHLVVDRRGNGLETSGDSIRVSRATRTGVTRAGTRVSLRSRSLRIALDCLSPRLYLLFSPAPAASRPLSSPRSPDNVIHSALLAVNQLASVAAKKFTDQSFLRAKTPFLFRHRDS